MDPKKLRIGVMLPIWASSMDAETPRLRDALALARHAEAVGLDSLWLSDHLYWEAFVDFRAVGIEPPAEWEGVKGGQWE